MYHDRHFQTNNYFPLIAFNHEQIKHSTTGGFLLKGTYHFHDIADQLLNINQDVLEDLMNWILEGRGVKAETDEDIVVDIIQKCNLLVDHTFICRY